MASQNPGNGFFPISGGIEMLLPGREDEGANYRLPFRVATTSTVHHALRGIPDGAAAMPFLNNFLESIEVYSPHRSTGHELYRETTTSKEIRVLVLDPAHFGDPVVGRLRHLTIEHDCPPELKADYKTFGPSSWHFAWIAHTQLGVDLDTKEMVPYTALSYVWGDQSHLTPVMIDGHEKLITRSLLSALQKLRHQSEQVVLWIDQICIDQDSDLDKQKQIQLMGDIYKRAWTTAIWTGEEPDHGAFEALQSLHEATQGLRDLTEEQIEVLRRPDSRHNGSGATEKLEAFFDRAWFTRTWIIQEAVLSRDAYLLAGDNSIPWANLGGWSYDLAELGILREQSEAENPEGLQRMRGWRAAGEIYKLGEAFNRFFKLRALHTMVDTRDAQATKAVDKIYGVLGLCEIDITPDYTLAAYDLFFRVASLIVDEYFGHQVFSLLSCIDQEPQMDSPSSWTIDWSTPRMTQALGFTSSTFSCSDAGGYGMPVAKQSLCQRKDDKLMLRGKRFSTVNTLSPTLVGTRLIADTSALSSSALRICIDFATAGAPNLTATFPTFVNTLVAGKDGSARNKPPIELFHLASLLCDEASGKKPTFPDQIYSKRHQQGHFNLDHLKRRSMGQHFESFRKAFTAALTNRRLCWTGSGHLGLVPRYAQAGDEIWVFPYSAVPFVLRPTQNGQFLIIGEGYCHEVMDGKFAVDESKPLQDVVLI